MSLKIDEKEGDVTTTPTAGSLIAESSNATDPVLQKRVMLKLDAVVLGCFGVMYLMANLDRNNLVSRRSPQLRILTFKITYTNLSL